MEQAQALLERYLPVHNRKFAMSVKTEPAWRKTTSLQIERALCFKQQRTVAKDNTVTFEGTVLQIPKTLRFGSHAHRRVDVHVMLDGAVELFYKTEKIAAFDSKTTHALGLYRTQAKKEGFRYGPISLLQSQTDS
jgi:hypothetical protein